MIWRGLGVLAGAAALIVVGVVALARITVPDEPSFSEGLESASQSADGALDFMPTAIGGELEVTGAREGTITLERTVSGPSYGLGDDKARVFFDSDPLAIGQMSYDGLAFFPEPEDCVFTEGQWNEDLGITAVQVSCSELVDIRDNGTISIEGYAALPADLVMDLDIPDLGGTITVGDEDWQIVDPFLLVGSVFHEGQPGFSLDTGDPGESFGSLWLTYDENSGALTLSSIVANGGRSEVPSDACTVTSTQLMVVGPQAEIYELTVDCQSVEVHGMGEVTVEGSVVYQRAVVEDH